jgi:hypothetical protein
MGYVDRLNIKHFTEYMWQQRGKGGGEVEQNLKGRKSKETDTGKIKTEIK